MQDQGSVELSGIDCMKCIEARQVGDVRLQKPDRHCTQAKLV